MYNPGPCRHVFLCRCAGNIDPVHMPEHPFRLTRNDDTCTVTTLDSSLRRGRMAETEISRSLAPLRDVVGSLSRARRGHYPRGAERRRLVRRTQAAGAAVLPSLVRALCSEQAMEATWAAYLLRRMGGERVITKLHTLLRDTGVDDDTKARAIGVLADLKATTPD